MSARRSDRSRACPAVRMRGVTLIELMVALVLGLILSGAALALFVTNRQTYVASESLGRVQETARTAFELMARDLREAAGNPCDNSLLLANVLKNGATYAWWSNWDTGIKGYAATTPFADDGFGTAAKKRVSGTEAIEFKTAVPTGSVVATSMATTLSPITVNAINGTVPGDVLVICDYRQGAMFQATSISGLDINHAASGATPGNIDGTLPPDIYKAATATNAGALLAKLRASRWYVGYNGRGGKSLYQTSLRNTTGTPVAVTDEIAEGVDNMTLQYLEAGAAAYTSTPADWRKVAAVKVGLNLTGQDKIGSDGNPLQRTLEYIVTLRNRAP